MALMIFERTKPQVKAKSPAGRLISFNRKHDVANFNVCATRELGIINGNRIQFAKDTETKQWFFIIGTKEDLPGGHALQVRANKAGTPTATVHARNVMTAVCEDFKTESISFYITQKPKFMEGRQWWRIITATPYRKK